MLEPIPWKSSGSSVLCEEIRTCLKRHLSRVNAELVLRRGASCCGVLPEALELGQVLSFLEGADRALSLYLEGTRLLEARRALRSVLARMGARVPLLPRTHTPIPTPPPQPRLGRPGARAGLSRPSPSSSSSAAGPSIRPLPEPVELPMAMDADLEAARQEALRYGRALGLSHVDTVKVATVVSELARNILQYAGKGQIRLAPLGSPLQGLLLMARDQGPGIQDIEAILGGHYRSRTGMGLGIYGSKKLMDRFEVETAPGRGTTITAEKHV